MGQNIPLTFLWYNWSAAGINSIKRLLTQRHGVEYSSSLCWTLSTKGHACTCTTWSQVTSGYRLLGGNPGLREPPDTLSLQTQSFTVPPQTRSGSLLLHLTSRPGDSLQHCTKTLCRTKEVLKQTLADWILKVRNALLQQMYNPLCPPQTPDPSQRREIFTQVSRVPVKYYA